MMLLKKKKRECQESEFLTLSHIRQEKVENERYFR